MHMICVNYIGQSKRFGRLRDVEGGHGLAVFKRALIQLALDQLTGIDRSL